MESLKPPAHILEDSKCSDTPASDTSFALQKAAIAATLESMGLLIESEFVPFSQSRNKGEQFPSLNWKVTVKRNSRNVLTVDYSAGIAHCPSFEVSPPWNRPSRMWIDKVTRFECEAGFKARSLKGSGKFSIDHSRPIKPDMVDVFYSLVGDSDVLNSHGFEDWASEFGYDPDSRKAESIYRDCLDIALKLRGAIGESGMETLRNAYQDY